MKKIFNAPNTITFIRILLVPVFVAFVLYPIIPDTTVNYIVCAAVFSVTALTDMLDGKIARKYGLVTNLGKFADALVDKFMIYSAYIAISVNLDGIRQRALVWLTVVIILRDLAINGIRMMASGKGKVIAAQLSGKLKTTTQCLSVVILLLEPAAAELTHIAVFENGVISLVFMALTLIATVWSGADYIKDYSKFIELD